MTTRDSAPIGSPCWADLWTSDVEGSRTFYGELFGWEAQEPSPEFGGYFMFTRNGVPVAGGMGDMGDMPANNTWKIYLATDDIAKTVEAAEADGRPDHRRRPWRSPTSASRRCSSTRPAPQLGAWQPGTFPGFTVLERARCAELVRAAHPRPRRRRRLLPLGVPLGDRHRRRHRRVPLHDDARPRAATASWPGSWTPPPSSPTASPSHWSSTGRSTTPTPPSPRSRPSAARS